MLVYSLIDYPEDWRLLLNYGANFALVYVMVHYRIWPRVTSAAPETRNHAAS